jgi:choline dehydrogenase-like flavoprotein
LFLSGDASNRVWRRSADAVWSGRTLRLQAAVPAASPPRFGTLHRAALEASKNVTVLLSCPAIEIQSDPGGSARIVSVVVVPAGGQRYVLRARRFVLASGTIESARLVLSSMRNGALRASGADVVGRYFMDHGEGEVGIVSARALTSAPISRLISEAKPYNVQGFLSAIGISAPAQRKWQLQNIGFEIAAVSEAVREDAEFAALAETDRLRAYLSESESAGAATFRLTFRSETRPNPGNRVTLTEEHDPLGVPRVKLHYRWSAEDMRGVDMALRLLAQDWSGPHGVLLRQLRQADQCVGSSLHQMGTTRMGDDPRSSWVDGNCKVHSVPNLYVAGSSVFPTVGWANPTLTIVALAIRLAELLKRSDGGGN